MPRMNGFEFLAEYATRAEGLHRRQAIVMVPKSTLRRDKARAKADALVMAYEVKPLTSYDSCRIVKTVSQPANLLPE